MIKSVFGESAKSLHISSTKSEIGHMVGAAGSIEAIMCIKAIEDSFVPPTSNLDNPDLEHGCDLDYTPNKGVACEIKASASCSLGFGGHNGCIILKKI
jgi:3-oxoacyl-[acyl-carrier-protein] synthase II